MSPQDTQLLENFLNQLIQARGLPKDPEADAMIQKAVAYQPDAAYLLVQRALLQQQALDNAKAEIANLQRQLQGGQQSGGSQGRSFLDPNAWGNGAGQRQPTQAYDSQASQQTYPQQQYQQPYQQPSLSSRASNFFRGGMGGGGMGGALGNIASTAAGVAAGAFLFQGLGNLLGQHTPDGNGFLGNNDSFSSLTSPIEDFHNSSGDAGDSSNSLLGDSGTDNGGGNSMLDDLGMDTDNFAGDNYDGGSDDIA
jgi:hypothetical protein